MPRQVDTLQCPVRTMQKYGKSNTCSYWLIEWITAGVFGIEQEVYVYGFNLSFSVICVKVVESILF